MRLPYQRNEEHPMPAPLPYATPTALTVLLVEDDPMVRDALSLVIEVMGHRLVTASNGRAALAALEDWTPDVVVTDLVMPELDGIGLILALRHARPELKVIAMSGGGRSTLCDYLAMAVKLGATSMLQKPFDGHELAAAIAAAHQGEAAAA